MNNELTLDERIAEIKRLLAEEEKLEDDLSNILMHGYAIGVSAQAKADRG